MQIEINGTNHSIVVNRKKNKNTYIRVNDNKDIVVTTSIYTSDKDILKVVNANIQKLEKMLENKKILDPSAIYFKGIKLDVVLINSHKNITIEGGRIYGPTLKKINNWLEKEIYNYFLEILDSEYKKFKEKIPYPKLKIRKMKSRWGVCNRREVSVTLNTHLMKYREEVTRYVIIHELSHFVHFDHSNRFWDLVAYYCPNYKQIKKELKG